jgi:translation initiation factor 3 subunit B
LLRDLEKATAVAEEFAEPAAPEHTETDDYRWWLLDERCFDQFVVRADQDTTVYWCTKHEPETIVTRPNWTESYFLWSPRGSYLGTIHVRGVQLWGMCWELFMGKNASLLRTAPCCASTLFTLEWPSG